MNRKTEKLLWTFGIILYFLFIPKLIGELAEEKDVFLQFLFGFAMSLILILAFFILYIGWTAWWRWFNNDNV